MGAAPEPPGYRPQDTPGERCGVCRMYDQGLCWGYGNKLVQADHVCDSWAPEGAQRNAPLEVPMPEDIATVEERKDYSDAERQEMAKSGEALPDGNVSDLKNAISAYGRAGNKAAAKAHIIKRAKALGATDLIPEDWRSDPAEHRADPEPDGDDPCPVCDGTGTVMNGTTCPACDGTGVEAGEQENTAPDELERRARHAQERKGMVEFRAIPSFEVRDTSDGHVRFSGYASTTEVPYEIADFTETIARGAFKRTLGEDPDVRLNVNHGMGGQLPLARTKSGTLTLSEDARGLKVDADLDPNDPDVKSLLPKLQRGDVDEMSFAFRATVDEWDERYENRLIRECALHRGDVSIVTTGANPDTTAVIRSEDGNFELRIGKAISNDREALIKETLDHMTVADSNLDEGLEKLSQALGVPNPDEDKAEEEAERDRGEQLKITVHPRSYLEAAKAKRARLL